MIIWPFDEALDHMWVRVFGKNHIVVIEMKLILPKHYDRKNVEVRMITEAMNGNTSPYHDSTDSSHLATKGSSWFRNFT